MENQYLIGLILFNQSVIPDSTCRILAVSPRNSDISNGKIYFCEIIELGKVDYCAFSEEALSALYASEKPTFSTGMSSVLRYYKGKESLSRFPLAIEDVREIKKGVFPKMDLRLKPDRRTIGEIRNASDAARLMSIIGNS